MKKGSFNNTTSIDCLLLNSASDEILTPGVLADGYVDGRAVYC